MVVAMALTFIVSGATRMAVGRLLTLVLLGNGV